MSITISELKELVSAVRAVVGSSKTVSILEEVQEATAYRFRTTVDQLIQAVKS